MMRFLLTSLILSVSYSKSLLYGGEVEQPLPLSHSISRLSNFLNEHSILNTLRETGQFSTHHYAHSRIIDNFTGDMKASPILSKPTSVASQQHPDYTKFLELNLAQSQQLKCRPRNLPLEKGMLSQSYDSVSTSISYRASQPSEIPLRINNAIIMEYTGNDSRQCLTSSNHTLSIRKRPLSERNKRSEDLTITCYKDDIATLSRSILAYGLEEVEIIELYVRMTPDQLGRYLSSSRPKIEDVRKPELTIIQAKLADLIKQNHSYIVQHYADIFIAAISIDDLVDQAEDSLRAAQKEIEKEANSPSVKQVLCSLYANESFKIKYQSVSTPTMLKAIAKSQWIARNMLEGIGIFQQFKGELKRHLGTKLLRTKVYNRILGNIFETILNADAFLEDWHFMVEDKSARQLKMIPFSNIQIMSLTDIQGAQLAMTIRNLVHNHTILDVTALSEKDIEVIHSQIQRDKLAKTYDFNAFLLAQCYLPEIIQFKNTLAEYTGKIFYGYAEITDQIMATNKEMIHKIRQQPARGNLEQIIHPHYWNKSVIVN